MRDRKAFGKGLRMLRIARGLPQWAFAPVCAANHEGALERGAYAPSVEMVASLADVLNVHPLTLLAAMYVERDGLSVPQLLLQVRDDFNALSSQLPANIGRDTRDRSELFAALQQWLLRCLAGDDGVSMNHLDQEVLALQKRMEAALGDFTVVAKDLRTSKEQRPSRKQWPVKIYRNPHTGEEITVKSRNNGRLKAWVAEYGVNDVDDWIVRD